MFTLAQHGDPVEQAAWPLFLCDEFSQYEEFWRLFIVELTCRVHNPTDTRLRPKEELQAAGRDAWHVEVAQLHYTTLLHLIRVFDLRQKGVHDRDSFFEAIVRLDAATDTAFELLGHCLIDRGKSEPWNERAGERVRRRWDNQEPTKPFKALHDYRNSLLHGRARTEHPALIRTGQSEVRVPLYPTLDTMQKTLDWREADPADAAPANQIVDDAWTDVLAYLRDTWAGRLIPWARKTFTEPGKPPQSFQLHAVEFGAIPARALSAEGPAEYHAPAEYHGGSIEAYPRRTPPDDQSG